MENAQALNGDAILDLMMQQSPVETKSRVIEASVEAMRTGRLQPDTKIILAFTDALIFADDAQLSSLARAALGFVVGLAPELEPTSTSMQKMAERIVATQRTSPRDAFLSHAIEKIPDLHAIQYPIRPALNADTVIGRLRGLSVS